MWIPPHCGNHDRIFFHVSKKRLLDHVQLRSNIKMHGAGEENRTPRFSLEG